jgi:hypothetical protein
MSDEEIIKIRNALLNSRLWLGVYMSEFDLLTPVILKEVDNAIQIIEKEVK